MTPPLHTPKHFYCGTNVGGGGGCGGGGGEGGGGRTIFLTIRVNNIFLQLRKKGKRISNVEHFLKLVRVHSIPPS